MLRFRIYSDELAIIGHEVPSGLQVAQTGSVVVLEGELHRLHALLIALDVTEAVQRRHG